ncbi:hypothetical protein A1O7_01352 [Cladophialophora yegresii CBS 114405]|uniref:Uncharacterized protein n=1 Tax=Cladophialophora yegresii CBS 114405 TaxID=1182544 RepID=W9WAQ3_9EURO|nr:uncharacterized protein A1O7_01352 [Cladophialophora yegresii CBS 114405]EXJ65013.1 hypothetical protein A1O7_01352 [Cladophialophora yegresii CBS 114405]
MAAAICPSEISANKCEKMTNSFQERGGFLPMQRFMAEDSRKQPWSTVHLTSETSFHCVHAATTSASRASTSLPDSSSAATNGSAKAEVAGEIKPYQTCSEFNHGFNKICQHGNGAHQHNGKRNPESNARCNRADLQLPVRWAQPYGSPSQRQQLRRREGSTNHGLLYIGYVFADEGTAGGKLSRSEGGKIKELEVQAQI